MKRIFSAVLTLALLLTFSAANAEDSKKMIEKLKSYPDTYFAATNDEVARKEESNVPTQDIDELIQKRTSQIIADLKSSVKILSSNKNWDSSLLSEVVRLSNLLQQNDPSGYVGAILLPLYKKDKKTLLQEIRKLPKKDATDLEDTIKSEDHVNKYGNG